MGFQRVVNNEPAPAVEGDFASNNPMSSLIPPVPGAFVVGDANVRIGYFAWGSNTGKVYSSLAAATADGGPVIGFVARQPNIPAAMITAFLGENIMTLQLGREVTLMSAGDFYANVPGATPSAVANIFALATTGAPSLVDDASTEPTGFRAISAARVDVVTAATSTIAVNTGILTVATVSSGGNNIQAGDKVTGTGVPAETYVVRQLTGTAGGAGTYQTNSINRAAVAAAAFTFHQGTLAKISKAAA
jgi:hypothetical protein